MIEFIRAYQLDLMLLLCGACAILTILLFMTHFLSRSRKTILILMEIIALFLLWFDRWAYVYAGDISNTGYVMVRLSNFMVFFLTSGVVFVFNMYLMDYLSHEGGMDTLPVRLKITGVIPVAGMLLAVVSAFTGLYYYFDETNLYHRGSGFLIAYIIPVICPLVQFTVIQQYRKIFRTLIYISLLLYIFVPLGCGILQIFTYGISIVNISMVTVSIFLFLFSYVDINNYIQQVHETEIRHMQGENEKMQRLFDQTATAFVSAVEKKDDFAKGSSVKVAEYAKRIAQMSGKTPDECEKVYYAALLHDVGMIGIPDRVIKNEQDPGKWDFEMMRKKPLIGREILSSITEYPYLEAGAHYSHERYNGTGYPEGLKGEEIPEIARIIGVADAYVTMTSRKRYRGARPDFMVREAFVKGSGVEFDPVFADIMVKIMDADSSEMMNRDENNLETGLICNEYRDAVSFGIPVNEYITHVSFECFAAQDADKEFSVPSVILFDSYDRRIHDNKKAIDAYKYLEYGELWFDEHSITTAARKMKETVLNKTAIHPDDKDNSQRYEITMCRYEDHLKLLMKGPTCEKEVIAALPGGSTSAYAALTGEHCVLKNIVAQQTSEHVSPEDIPRIADAVSYTDRLESDLKNIQIDRTRSAATDGVELRDRLRLMFHTMSLPGANLIWHCPYIVIFYSDNGKVNGGNYREYALIKLYGENEGEYRYSHNSIDVKKTQDFPGWDVWKEANKTGLECEVSMKRKDNVITIKTENLGIELENTTTIDEDKGRVYAALTGDQVAITDIRIH